MSDDTVVVAAAPGPAPEVNGLHSPPDSNMKDASDSELSDLDEEQPEQPGLANDDIGEIEPAYYSDDGVPVFLPSMEQFKDFTRFMTKITKYGMRSGIVKVIPPPEWKAAQPRLDEAVKTIRVKEPIKQDIMGTSGTYRQANIVHQRSYNLPQWRQLCDQSDHQPPAKRGERRANQDKQAKPIPKTRSTATPSSSASKGRGRGRPPKGKASRNSTVEKEDEGQATPDRLPTPVSPLMKPEEDNETVKLDQEDVDESPSKPKFGSRQAKAISVSSRRKNNRREVAGKIDEAAFVDFKYELEEEFPPERCEDLERSYWKTLTYAPPLYGADMPGTLFTDQTTSWNLGKLDNILDVMGSKIPGVNTAYLYLGMWKATFAWHLEDVDLYSINYLHFGAPKQWYSIAQGDARRFEAAMKTIWPTDAKACDQFLRHKTFLISPQHLLSNFNIKVNKIVAHPGEFVITFPYGYHSGYNLGYNCAEAVNFGLEEWLEYGRVAKKCDCDQAQDSVWINVHELERKMRGEETEYEETDEEDEEEEEGGLPTPPDSNGDSKLKIPKKKRKRSANDKSGNDHIKRVRIRIKAPSKEPCILCPNDIPSEDLLPTEEIGSKVHRICAMYIPETSVDEDNTKEFVTDVKYIDKARLELKCNYCRSKKGACFQCSQKKCTRAYHATCAAAAGVEVQQGEVPRFGEDGTEYKEWGIEFSCRFHRTKRDKKFDGDALENDGRLREGGAELKIGEVCQAQYYRGDIFAGAVVENRRSEETVLLDILPRGERVEVEYKWLLIPDPADYHLDKPSANAIPMPKSRKDKQSLNTSRRQADDNPRRDDPFVEGHTWAEFKMEEIARNVAQCKVNFAKEGQLWHYLGRNSTEARAQFTEDLAKPRNNPKANFLDTLPRATAPTIPRHSYSASYPTKTSHPSPNVSRAPSRPPLPPSNKSEKPYAYKPRDIGDTYRVDQQAYRSQQSFLQQSAPSVPPSVPYSFGTDPRYQTAQPNRPNQYSRPASGSPLAPPPVGPLAPPTQYRPPHPAAMPSRPSNPFTGRAPQNSRPSKPNPFANYTYLQKEHNRSPLEYKSPYRPGGGFMNGYQGNLGQHLQQTLFQKRSGSAAQNSTLYTSARAPYIAGQPSPTVGSYSPSNAAPYANYGGTTASQKQPPAPGGMPTAAQNSWERRDTQLHAAIRQEYTQSPMFHQHYQPPRQPTQYQGSAVLQPPPMWNRQAYQPGQMPQGNQAPPQQNQGYSQAPYSQAPRPQQPHVTQPQSYHTSPGPQTSNASWQSKQFPKPAESQNAAPSYQPPQYQPSNPGTQSSPHNMYAPSQPQGQYRPSSSHQSAQPLSSIAQKASQSPTSHGQSSPTLQDQENKAVYPHQQYFQKPQAQVPQPYAHAPQKYEPADVPVDSTSIIEKIMLNLKGAKPANV
ncbi:DNA damage-responsive transcriptional repressor RPH1 [Lachnellula arida]|uniref:[histone H3]-trimethyl-L-lysine(9) demethylase n=1 Tax=Lachnellula arida TaxID=1316785 RepID=A0A8T9BIH9_9HELO|nr:DNA damage-responsive transcriptional repressor RPH1 [Lachnellula arida]